MTFQERSDECVKNVAKLGPKIVELNSKLVKLEQKQDQLWSKIRVNTLAFTMCLRDRDCQRKKTFEACITKQYEDVLKMQDEKRDIVSTMYDLIDNEINGINEVNNILFDINQPTVVYGLAVPVVEMPIDPHEPTYCNCKQVSFGEMILCDNKECTVEWFHFECVGLSQAPTGDWYCEECTNLLGKNGRKKRKYVRRSQ